MSEMQGGAGQSGSPMTWATWFSSRDHLWWGPPLFECDLKRIKGTAWWSDNLLESFTLLADDRYCVAYNRGEDAKRRIFLSPHVARKIMNGEEEQSYFRWMLADVHVIHCAVNFFGELKGASESSSRWQPEPSGVQCRPELGILRYVPTAAQTRS